MEMDIIKKPIAIFGLGYVGLPLSLCYCMKGYSVYGVDISEKLIDELKSGETSLFEKYKGHTIKEILGECLNSQCFMPTNNPVDALLQSNKHIITVGIPVNNGNLDYMPLKNVCRTISKGLKNGDTVIVRSTVTPGTTEDIIIPILEESSLKAGKDFYLAYCPERISEGNAFEGFENLRVIISGVNEESIEIGSEIIKMISNVDPFLVSSIKTAEASKLFENIQRDVNIAMIQEIGGFCRNIGIDVFELIEAVNTHPRVNLLKPAPGVGGYCIPNALYYLKSKALEMGTNIDLICLSRDINMKTPINISNRIKQKLISKGKEYSQLKVAILGVAMKDYCNDIRNSPVIEIIKDLINSGISVAAYDPYVSENFLSKADDLEKCINDSDCLLIAAKQYNINYNNFDLFKSLMNDEPLIFDTRNIVDCVKAFEYGFKVEGI